MLSLHVWWADGLISVNPEELRCFINYYVRIDFFLGLLCFLLVRGMYARCWIFSRKNKQKFRVFFFSLSASLVTIPYRMRIVK